MDGLVYMLLGIIVRYPWVGCPSVSFNLFLVPSAELSPTLSFQSVERGMVLYICFSDSSSGGAPGRLFMLLVPHGSALLYINSNRRFLAF